MTLVSPLGSGAEAAAEKEEEEEVKEGGMREEMSGRHIDAAVAAEFAQVLHPGGNPGANFKSISHRCHLFEVAFPLELTKENTPLPLCCLHGGFFLCCFRAWS